MSQNKTLKKKSNFLLSILAVFVVGGLCLTGAHALYGEQMKGKYSMNVTKDIQALASVDNVN